MEKVLSTQSIIDLFSDAIKTDRKLPPEFKNNLKTMKFDVVNDKTEHNAWEKRPLRVAANSKDIARYEFVLFELNPRLQIEERTIMWSKAVGLPYTKLGRKLGMSRHQVKEKYLELIIFIKYLIAYDKKLFDKFCKIA